MRTRREVLGNVVGVFVLAPLVAAILWWAGFTAVRWVL